jgi:ATP-dependent exoDNAse (exonuclease V) beta subunit
VKAPSGTFLELLWHQVGAAFEAASVVQADTKTAATASFIPRLMRLPLPAIPALLQQTVAEQPATSFDTMTGEGLQTDAFSADMGSLAHRYVEMIARQGMTQWPLTRLASLRPSMQRWLEQRSHQEALAKEGAERVLAVLATTLNSAEGQWVLQQHEAAACELEILRQEGAVIRRYVVDRTFIEQGTRWIIDYKSARFGEVMAESALAQAAELYRPQLTQYAALFAHESRPVRIAVFFLSIGQLVELD